MARKETVPIGEGMRTPLILFLEQMATTLGWNMSRLLGDTYTVEGFPGNSVHFRLEIGKKFHHYLIAGATVKRRLSAKETANLPGYSLWKIREHNVTNSHAGYRFSSVNFVELATGDHPTMIGEALMSDLFDYACEEISRM